MREVKPQNLRTLVTAAAWSRGMILALGARGPGFDSRSSPYSFFLINLNNVMNLNPGAHNSLFQQPPTKQGEADLIGDDQQLLKPYILAQNLQQIQIHSQEEFQIRLQKELGLTKMKLFMLGQVNASKDFSSLKGVQSNRTRPMPNQQHHYSPSMGTIPANSHLVTQQHSKMSPTFDREEDQGQPLITIGEDKQIEEGGNLSVLQESIVLLKESVRRLPSGGYDTHINSILVQLDNEWVRIRDALDGCERLRKELAVKAKQLEKFELETLETKVQLDYKCCDYEQKVLALGGRSGSASREGIKEQCVQTSLGVENLQRRENNIRSREKEIEFQSFKINEEIEEREKFIALRERDIEVREQVMGERIGELEKREKIAQQRLFKLKTAPLDALEDRDKMNERIKTARLLSAAGQDLERLEGMYGFGQFWKREDVQDFYNEFSSSQMMRQKALGLLQCEFMILKEREKCEIAAEYIEKESQGLERERETMKQEREKYLYLNDFERYIQTENAQIEEKREELSRLTKSLIEGAESIQTQGGAVDISALLVSASPSGVPGSRTPNSQFDMKTAGVRSVMEGSSNIQLAQSQQVLQNITSAVSRNFNPSLAESVERMTTIQNLKKELLTQQSYSKIGGANTHSLRMTPPRYEEQELSPERTDNAIKKLLQREASFLDQEKRILDEQRKRLKTSEGSAQRKNPRGRGLEEGGKNRGATPDQISILKHQLELEIQLQKEMNAEVNLELRKLENRTEVLNTREERFNAEKVRFLKRFDRLRAANKKKQELSGAESEQKEESDGDDSVYSYEIDALLQREIEIADLNPKSKQTIRQEAIVRAAVLARLSQLVLLKNPHKKPRNVKLIAAFQLWQLKGHIWKSLITLRKSRMLVEVGAFEGQEERVQQGRVMEPGANKENEGEHVEGDNWWNHYWQRRSRALVMPRIFPKGAEKKDTELVKLHKQMDRKLLNEIERFWRFRAKNVLRLTLLHYRRRQRISMAFSFFRFRVATSEAKVQFIIQQRHRYAYSKAFTVTTSERVGAENHKTNSNASMIYTVGKNQEIADISPEGRGASSIRASADEKQNRRFIERQSPSLVMMNQDGAEYEDELGGLNGSQIKNIGGSNLPPEHDTFAGGASYILGGQTAYLQNQIQQTPQMNKAEEFNEETLGRPRYFGNMEHREVQVEMLAEEIGRRVFQGLTRIARVMIGKSLVNRKVQILRAWCVWVKFSKSAEMLILKGELSRVAMALQDIKFQDNMFRANVIMQRNELESKIRELVVARLGFIQ